MIDADVPKGNGIGPEVTAATASGAVERSTSSIVLFG
jgi:hypothetical protein